MRKSPPHDSFSAFEARLAPSGSGRYVLRLYITGNTPQSTRAIVNLKKLCETRLRGRYELTIVDLYQTPKAAQAEQIICTPTLIKELPLPLRRLVGDLSDRDRVLLALNLTPEGE